MRLDLFLPILRKPVKGKEPRKPGLLARLFRKILPKFMLDDQEKIRPGLVRRALKKIGATTASSPVRRGIQAVCFLAFLAFFFYVCWPYSAQPVQKTGAAEIFLPESTRDGNPDKVLAKLEIPAEREKLRAEAAAAWKQHEKETLIVAQSSVKPAWVDRDLHEIAKTENLEPADAVLALLKPGETAVIWKAHYADDRARKEKVEAEFFLIIDPLVSISTALASKTWEWSLWWAIGILVVCLLFPRGFCGYLCPLGTLIDLFDWAIGKRVSIFRVKHDGWWVNFKYYLLAGILFAAFFGVLFSGFFSAIPVITRGMLYIFDPLQTGYAKGWHQVPPLTGAQIFSIVLFIGVLCLGFMRKRFWCRYVCPSGAVFSFFNLFRAAERKVESSCIGCNKCVEICPFDAIKADWTTRTSECTLCQSCGGVCPTHSIKFVERWNFTDLKKENEPPVSEKKLDRRGFLTGVLGAGLAAFSVKKAFGADLKAGVKQIPEDVFAENLTGKIRAMPIRPPGSVPEPEFLQMCIRCGECFKACPNHVLQPEGFEQGLEGLWTPMVKPDWAGCESSCNNCGQVCPTGAIRALPLIEKRVARIGLAIINENTCLPHAGKEACQMCVDECTAAGYNALEFVRVRVEIDPDDPSGAPLPDSGFAAPVVIPEKCVGCGLCQSRCHNINVLEKKMFAESAIVVVAGQGSRKDGSPIEDRMLTGSYLERRKGEAAKREEEHQKFLKQQGVEDENLFVIPGVNDTPAKSTPAPAPSQTPAPTLMPEEQ